MSEQQNPTVEQPTVETPQVETPVVEATQNTTTTVEEKPTEVQEPIKPFELPQQPNPISFDKPEDVLSAYKGDKKALLKQLGELDDFSLGLIDYYKATGDVTPYLEVKTVDWTKLPAEKVAEAMLREQYSKTGLAEDKIQKLVQRDMRNKYMLGDEHDSESEDVQLARIQMEADANLYRQQRIAQQQQFKAPERVVEETPPTPSAAELMEQSRNLLLQDQSIQSFLKDKKVSFGDYNHVIENPQETLQTIYDSNKWQYHLAQKTPDGKVVMKDGQPVLDNAKMLKVAAYVENMEKIEQALITQGKSLGQKEIIDEAENVNNRGSQGSNENTDDLQTLLAKKIMERQR
jgi:hypothetical protein